MPQIELRASDATSWFNWVTNFDRTFPLFQRALADLRAKQSWARSRHPELLSQIQNQLSLGDRHAATMQQLQSTRNSVTNWLRSVGRVIGNTVNTSVNWLRDTFGLGEYQEPEQLGLAPIVYVGISLAGAVAALVAVAYWTNETLQLNSRLTAIQNLEARGYTPEAAANAVSVGAGDQQPIISQTGVFGIPWLYVIGGVAALVLLPRLMDRING